MTLASRRRRLPRYGRLLAWVAVGSAIAAVALASVRVEAQQGALCGAVAVPSSRPQDNIFSAEQEEELGLVAKAYYEEFTRVIDDPALTGYLRTIGDRLVSRLPPSHPQFHFALADSTDTNAFSLPSGWVYVTRKLVGLLHSEDELAAVLAHEIGHNAMRQHAVSMTRVFRKTLGVTSLETGRVADRFHEVIESGKPMSGNLSEDDQQEAADRVGLQVLRASGYPADSMASIFDRLAALEGRKGNWFTDAVGLTAPNAKRLRTIAREADATSPCAAPATSRPEDFAAWRDAVLHYAGIGHAEALPGLTARRKLAPVLQPDLRALRFSPDGRYVLAQDDSTISVFQREGLRPLFQIPARGGRLALFSADSRHLSFYSSPTAGSPRVETWSLADRTSTVHELYVREGCLQSALSPDGEMLACVVRGDNYNQRPALVLRVIAVATEKVVVQKYPVAVLSQWELLAWLPSLAAGELPAVNLGFSPDGRTLLVGSQEVAEGFDLRSGKAIELESSVKQAIRSPFSFLDDRRIVSKRQSEVQVLTVPEGQPVVEHLPVGVATARPVTRGDFLVIGPLKTFPAGVLDFRTRKLFTVRRPMVDVFDDVFVAEREDGRIALYATAGGKELATVSLADSQLGSARAGVVSPDGRWLGISSGARGAVWDVVEGRRVVHVRGFDGGWLGEPNAFTAVVREDAGAKPGVLRFDLAANPPAYRVAQPGPEGRWSQQGRFVLAERPGATNPKRDATVEARDVSDPAVLWKRTLAYDAHSKPADGVTGQLVLTWLLSDDDARKAVTGDPAWQDALRAFAQKDVAVCFEVMDIATGKVRARVAVDSNVASLPYSRVSATADRVFVLESRGRLLAYSFDGRLQGRAFAREFALAPDGKRVAASSAPGRLAILRGADLAPVAELAFDSPVCLSAFQADSRYLVVVTADQSVYTFDLESAGSRTR